MTVPGSTRRVPQIVEDVSFNCKILESYLAKFTLDETKENWKGKNQFDGERDSVLTMFW